MDDKKLRKSDIWQIVQVFDTDGTYVPETAIVQGDTKEFYYTESTISCKNRQKIIDRNEMKSRRMEYLLQLDCIKDIPYKCYFMSSNLDHACMMNKIYQMKKRKSVLMNSLGCF